MTSYTWLNIQGVRSSDGLEIQYSGRWSLEVRWGKRRKVLDCEGTVRPEDLSNRSFEQWDNSSVANSAEEQERLLKVVQDALAFMMQNDPPKHVRAT